MYECINGWTKQRMLEHVKKEFKGKSIRNNDVCMYRGPNSTKCAVGMFIPDEMYSSKMDYDVGIEVIKLLQLYPDLNHEIPLDPVGLRKFQNVHDKSTSDTCFNNIISWIETNVKEST